MNSLTMTHGYKLHLVNFQRSLEATSGLFPGLTKRVLGLIHRLEAAFGIENEISINHLREVAGSLILNLEFQLYKIDLSKEEWINKAFPGCTITGNMLEIPFIHD